MRWVDFVWFALSTLAAGWLTWGMRTYSIVHGLMDIPNARSSHENPVPRGGGVAIVVTTLSALAALVAASAIEWQSAVAMGLGGASVGLIGYIDDWRGLTAQSRMGVHVGAALIAVAFLGFGTGAEATMRWWVMAPLVIGVVWSVNLFNFMDGIDGIAASQALFVAIASVLLIVSSGISAPGWTALLMSTAGACLGFLLWNWPPARIFMGDVGSGFLGYWLGVLAVALWAFGILDIWASIILNAIFISDASVTLLRRILEGSRWYEAHRSHAYQILARRLGHRRVTSLVWLINLFVVLPLATLANTWKSTGLAIALALLVALAGVSMGIGAGKRVVT